MHKIILGIATALVLFLGAGTVKASLTTIGTATYNGDTYNLIYDDDAPMGPIVWLDYTNYGTHSDNQKNWAAGIDSDITSYNFNTGYSITWTEPAWRLPATVDGTYVYGYEGDPDHDGTYTYTGGYNLANSEMGHLFYTELGNLGYVAIDGTSPQQGWGLTNTGDFSHLVAGWYWSGTDYTAMPPDSWIFNMGNGNQGYASSWSQLSGIAVRGAQVTPVPIPGAVWLLGSGLLGLAAAKRRKWN